MLDAMRKSADSPVLKVLFITIVLVFLFWGVGTVGTDQRRDRRPGERRGDHQRDSSSALYQRLAAMYQNMGAAGAAGRVPAQPGARPADRPRAAQPGSGAPRPDGRRSRAARRDRRLAGFPAGRPLRQGRATSSCCSRTATSRPISRRCSAAAWWRARSRSWCAAACTSATRRSRTASATRTSA